MKTQIRIIWTSNGYIAQERVPSGHWSALDNATFATLPEAVAYVRTLALIN